MEGNHPCLEHPSHSQTVMSTPTFFLNKFVFLSFVDSSIHVHPICKLAFRFIPGWLCLQVRSTDSEVREPGSNPDFATLSAMSPWFITIAINLLYLGSLICKMGIIKVLASKVVVGIPGTEQMLKSGSQCYPKALSSWFQRDLTPEYLFY